MSSKSNTELNEQLTINSEKKIKEINIFVILLSILLCCVLLNYVLPSGEYVREDVNGRSVIVPDSFQFTESSPVGFIQVLNSIPTGMVESAGIIFFILIIGGSFGILNSTGATEALIVTLSRKLGNNEKWLIPILMLFFALNGSLLGAFEETLPYIAILVPLVIALGFDAMTGVAIVFVGVSAGFTAAIMNPFTIGVAQKIAELPPYSGIGLRIVVFLLMYAVSVIFVYRHAMRVKRDPSLGIFGTIERKSREELISSSITLETKHKWILFVFLLNLVAIAIGVIKFGWYINEIAGLFILFGVIVGIIARLNTNKIVDEFMKGASALFYGALIIGVARAIVVILEQGHIMDTILFYCASLIEELPSSFTAVGMLVLQSIISFIIPSGSGMAALTMPIMTPLSELVGITRQTAVLAFQFGDGIWNLIVPGVALAGVGMVGISYVRWVKWIFPLLLIQFGIAAVVIFIAHSIGYGPF